MNPESKPHFDARRHFRQLLRDVLPIFLIVALVLAVVAAVFFSDRGERSLVKGIDDVDGLPRVSLLAAGDGDELRNQDLVESSPFDPAFLLLRPIDQVRAPQVARFDEPMGSEHGALTYNAQPFLISRHLGDDLNGIGGQDSDLGDAVYAVAEGQVGYAGWAGDGWGNVIAVTHRLPDSGRVIQSFYAHLDSMRVPVGELVRRGQVIGTVGKADGRYLAHLHFELRDFCSLSAGAGYADAAQGRLPGEEYLVRQRRAPQDWLSGPLQGVAPVLSDDEASLKARLFEPTGENSSAESSDADHGRDPVAIPRPSAATDDPQDGDK
jgi:murein DD-endopeptidase MepM/ murein hydrolase activator NlpD